MFRFQVRLTEEDYYTYNEYHNILSEQGKKQVRTMKILLSILALMIVAGLFLMGEVVTKETIVFAGIVFGLALLVMHLTYVPILKKSIKKQIQVMKQNGKLPFASETTLEFYDEYFVDIAPLVKTETSYAAVEKIVVLKGKFVFIYTSSVGAHLLPMSAFESASHFECFMQFIATKNSNIIYSEA